MDEHTEIFVALGAAAAACCGPCFEHYFSKAAKLGLSKEDVHKAVTIAIKVRGGAHMVMKGSIEKILKNESPQSKACCNGSSPCSET